MEERGEREHTMSILTRYEGLFIEKIIYPLEYLT